MRGINIYIQSKHQQYIYQFITLFNKKIITLLKSIKLRFFKKKYQPRFSILTSPHVNKKAQEQFETRLYCFQLKVQTFELLKLGIFLKRLDGNLFPNINLKIKLTADMHVKTPPISTIKTCQKKNLLKIIENSGVQM